MPALRVAGAAERRKRMTDEAEWTDELRPLPPTDWLVPYDESGWARDNRRMNALLMGREDAPA